MTRTSTAARKPMRERRSMREIATAIGLAREIFRSEYPNLMEKEKFHSFKELSELGSKKAAYVGGWLFFRRKETLFESFFGERREIWVRIHPASRKEMAKLSSLLRNGS